MILGVRRLGLDTAIDFDDMPDATIPDPDGSVYERASRVAASHDKYRGMVEQGLVTPQSPAQMRGSGALGPDMRTAQVTDPTSGMVIPDPGSATLEQQAHSEALWADPVAAMKRVDSAVSAPKTPEGVLAAASSGAASQPAPTDPNEGLLYMPGGTQTASTTITVKEGPQKSTQTRQVDAGAYGQSLDASANQDKVYRDEALRRLGLDPAHFDDQLAKIKSEQAANDQALADKQAQVQKLDQQYTQASQVPEDAARLWGQPGFAISAAIGGFFSMLMDLKQARKGQQSLNLGNRFWAQIDRIVDRDVQAQRANKSSQLAMLERQLGSAEAAVHAFRSQRFGLVQQELQTMQAKGMFDAQQREQIEGRFAEAQQKREEEKRAFLVAQAPVVTQQDATTRTQTTTQRTSVPGQWVSRLEMRRKELGITPEQWEKGMSAKLDPTKERSPTVSTALDAFQQMRDDTRTLEEVSGLEGKVVTRDVWERLSQGAQKVLGDLGVNTNGTTAVTSEMLQQLGATYLTKIAKASGGVITDSDIERAQAEFGNTTTGNIRYMRRLEREFEGNLKGALNTYFLGKGNQIIDMMRRGNAGITSLEAPSLRRRGSLQ